MNSHKGGAIRARERSGKIFLALVVAGNAYLEKDELDIG
jgi:hypothetical protein